MRNRVNIGTASIVLIFIILCLSVFSLLSLSDGKSALTFAQRKADSVTAYYEADSAGQALCIEIDTAASAPAAYYVYNKEDYLIDDSLPVWGG